MDVLALSAFLFGLMWGSFLNVIACRLITSQSIIFPRSHCPSCLATIAWYDLIPVLSWLRLRAKCRSCNESISAFYPFIEILSGFCFFMIYTKTDYPIAYAVFFSALLVSIRTDLEHMLISRLATIGMIPFAYFFAAIGLLPIALWQSLVGSVIGYLILYLIATIFYGITKKHGLGEGDFDLLAMIGAFIGLDGICITLSIGSWVGLIVGLGYILFAGKHFRIKIPFGPFLALGAMSYVFLQKPIMDFISTYYFAH